MFCTLQFFILILFTIPNPQKGLRNRTGCSDFFDFLTDCDVLSAIFPLG
jgi:hypothetical protein